MGSFSSANNGHAIATAKFFDLTLSACKTTMTTIELTTEEARAAWALLVGGLAKRLIDDESSPVYVNGMSATQKIEEALNAK